MKLQVAIRLAVSQTSTSPSYIFSEWEGEVEAATEQQLLKECIESYGLLVSMKRGKWAFRKEAIDDDGERFTQTAVVSL